MNPVYLLLLSSLLLLFQSPKSVQSIALSHLCGKFGHSCYGGNWGKRELPENFVMDSKKNEIAIDDDSMSNDMFEELRRVNKSFK
jgi:hypothetical protein